MAIDLAMLARKAMREANPKLYRAMWDRGQVMPAVKKI